MTTYRLGGTRDIGVRHCEELTNSASTLERSKARRDGCIRGRGSISRHDGQHQGQHKIGGELNHFPKNYGGLRFGNPIERERDKGWRRAAAIASISSAVGLQGFLQIACLFALPRCSAGASEEKRHNISMTSIYVIYQ